MSWAVVVKNQVPMIMTFREDEAEFIIRSLGHALEESYKIIDFFDFDKKDEEIW